jgi:phosphoribosylaminoimidazolecarboxamide formyltransferase/IMP cyclohydrolase
MKRALLSVRDKTGLVDLARALERCGVELVASGGTARTLAENGLPVTTVEAVTGFPELIGGRVKTLHPAIHAGILARRTPEHLAELAAHNLAPIDLVVVNLYPFEATIAREGVALDQAVEQIDIGGVALVRAAAKNFEWVTVLSDPIDYPTVAAEVERAGATLRATRARLAQKAFRQTANYDAAIAQYLSIQMEDEPFPATLALALEKVQDLRYGENPHQRAALYRVPNQRGLADARQLHGKSLSFTNWLDVEAAWRTANDYDEPAVAIIKHTTPCGLATAPSTARAYIDARECDPQSAFGGIVGLNREVDAETARAIAEIFTEVVVAPRYEDAALDILQRKNDLRLLEFTAEEVRNWDVRRLAGSFMVQETDSADAAEWRAVSTREPTPQETRALHFAWRAVKHVKSNAIVLARETRTVGIGAGQMSRVDAVRIAVAKAADRAQGAVLASDAFFPFADGVDEACHAGVTAIVQPGGSVRDSEAIEAGNRFGVAMVMTGTRHFRH